MFIKKDCLNNLDGLKKKNACVNNYLVIFYNSTSAIYCTMSSSYDQNKVLEIVKYTFLSHLYHNSMSNSFFTSQIEVPV